MKDFIDALKETPPSTVYHYLVELKRENKIELVGNPKITRGKMVAYWILK